MNTSKTYENKTFGLENLNNISFGTTEESGLGIVLADNKKGIAAYIQETEGSIFTPQVFNKGSFVNSFNRKWKDSQLLKH